MAVHKATQPASNMTARRRQLKYIGFAYLYQGQLHTMLLETISELFCKPKASCCEAYLNTWATTFSASGYRYKPVSIKDPPQIITEDLIWNRIAECQAVALIGHDAQADKEGKQGLVVLSGSPNPPVMQTGLGTFLDRRPPGACHPSSQIIIGGVEAEAVARSVFWASNTQVTIAGYQPNKVSHRRAPPSWQDGDFLTTVSAEAGL